ncbi:hemolysin family protein [Oceanibium sediminis]|uniref:hemolysin family protein n=1 Tax=Oceanibium sediminis TaxID=2026339 RepID=UPI000DD44538|nr:hemolysin family protein [Oceanibium sediminis]
MGDTNDGSSTAARGAQSFEDDTNSEEQTREPATGAMGFFNRILGLDTEDGPAEPETAQERKKRDDIRAEQAGHQAMLINLRNMRDVRVEDVAVPRADVVSVPDTSSMDELVAVFRESTYTRLPVYTDTLDSPVGFLHLKDFALRYGFNGRSKDFDLSVMLRPLLYVPPSMPIGVLLQKMQTERIHMALVIDEYGGVDGLVTIEDLVEQIVGDIADEHDTKEAVPWKEEAPGVYLCSARAPLEDFEEVAGVDLLADELDEDVETLGGLVFMLAGRVPLRGEVIPHPQGHEFEVVDADPRMVKRVRIRLRDGVSLDRAAE